MKQQVKVVGIVKKGDEILLMKKGRSGISASAFWELPGGRINVGEQPENALARIIYEGLSVQASHIKLKDAVTFVAVEGMGINRQNHLCIVYEVEINERERIVPEGRYTAYKFMKPDDFSGVKLNETSLAVLEMENGKTRAMQNTYRSVANSATVYVDGSSRGNPGPSGIGYYIIGEDGQMLKRGGEFIGFATSRMAEYYAMKEGCEQAVELGLKSVRFVSDNLMLVNQLNGIFKIRNTDVAPIYGDIQRLLRNFETCAFVHVKRAQNMEADAEANKAIDVNFDIK